MGMYYDVWKPPKGDSQSRLVYMRKEIIPKIRFDDLKLSLEIRCFGEAQMSKPAMMECLYKVRVAVGWGGSCHSAQDICESATMPT